MVFLISNEKFIVTKPNYITPIHINEQLFYSCLFELGMAI